MWRGSCNKHISCRDVRLPTFHAKPSLDLSKHAKHSMLTTQTSLEIPQFHTATLKADALGSFIPVVLLAQHLRHCCPESHISAIQDGVSIKLSQTRDKLSATGGPAKHNPSYHVRWSIPVPAHVVSFIARTASPVWTLAAISAGCEPAPYRTRITPNSCSAT
jgi:hypothetical protein